LVAAARILNRTVHAGGAWPLTALQFLKPLIRRTDPRLASIITLLSYFARKDWAGHADQLDRVLPGSHTTSVEAHLRAVLTAPGIQIGLLPAQQVR
jgi:hypothetical protein